MEDIPSWFWMVIVAGLSGMLGFIMYYLGMLLRETMLTTREVKYLIVEFHDVVDSVKMFLEKANRVVDTVTSTVESVSVSILRPIASLGNAINSIRDTIGRYTGWGEEE